MHATFPSCSLFLLALILKLKKKKYLSLSFSNLILPQEIKYALFILAYKLIMIQTIIYHIIEKRH